jgi:uroporphyrinogen decarboxylase
MNNNYINALLKEPTTRTPIWIMRQAGRYLPEYRATREKAGGFMSLCKSPELACEVTMQPIDRFDLDAAILFSDILTIPDSMGMGLYFEEGHGPKFKKTLDSLSDISKICKPDVGAELSYVTDAVSLIKQDLKGRVPLIGFSGSPWTLSTYMLEGGTSKNFSKVKGLLYNDPKHMHALLDTLADTVIDYLNAQIIAGADSIMIFDTWGGILTKKTYLEFSLRYMDKITNNLIREHNGKKIPITIFTKGGGAWVNKIAETGCDALAIDWTVDIGDIQSVVGDSVAIQGNLDPNVLYSNPEVIKKEVHRIMSQFKGTTGHVFNLGHGITPGVDPELVEVLVNAVHDFQRN